MLVVYDAAVIRSVIALHNLITNKLQNREAERSEVKDKDAAAAAKKKGESDEKKGETTGDTKKDVTTAGAKSEEKDSHKKKS